MSIRRRYAIEGRTPPGLIVGAARGARCGIPLVGLLLSRFEPGWLVAFGLAVSALVLFQMAGFNTQIDFRMLFVPINTAAFSAIAREKANRATGSST